MEKTGLKPFNELVKLDLKKHCQLKPTFYKNKDGKNVATTKDKWLEYIEWAKVLELLYEHGAKQVAFRSYVLDKKPNTLEIVMIIDGKDYITDYPIINGNAIVSNPNQMDIHRAELRGFVKCVAINTGLGLNLWMKEEQQTEEIVTDKPQPKELPSVNKDMFDKMIVAIREGKRTVEQLKVNFTFNNEQLEVLADVELETL
jgi:hypothetical protein